MPYPTWRKKLPKTVQKEKQSPPSKRKAKPPLQKKGEKRRKRPPEIEIVCTIFLEITHPMIISKYTLECIQLNYFLKIFSKDYTLESSSNKIGTALYALHH